MHDMALISTLTWGLTAALFFGYVTHRLGFSPIVGYLFAGISVGPHTPGFVADNHLAEQLAEIGVILLMFGVGLHFHFDELLAVRKIAVPGAIAQSFVATVLGAVAAWGFGWGWQAGVVFGLALSVASTVVLTRVLDNNNELHTPTGHIAVGWLVVEDLLTVLVLVLLPPIFGGGDLVAAIGMAVFKIGLLMSVAVPIGGRMIPWLLTKVADTGSRELFTLTVLVVALSIAVGSSLLFGVSMALGAFLAGMIVGRSDFSLRAAAEALPMRDAFAVLFFVSVGMLLEPSFLLEAPLVVIATLSIILLGKPISAAAIVLTLGYPLRVAIAVAVALGQIGEFSFILAALGTRLGVLPTAATNAIVVAAIASISINPLLYRSVDQIEKWINNRPKLWRMLTARVHPLMTVPSKIEDVIESRYRAVVVGYGPIGRTVCRLLRENDVVPIVVEMNLGTVEQLRSEGVAVVYGDASHLDTLKAAGVGQAGTLVLSSLALNGTQEMVRLARELNPSIRVISRSIYVHERSALRRAGADEVIAGEGEVALAMTESILRGLGATAEQIDRERDRVRADLFGEESADNSNDKSSESSPTQTPEATSSTNLSKFTTMDIDTNTSGNPVSALEPPEPVNLSPSD